MTARRLAHGGHIDRDLPRAFHFDGVARRGFAGDTLASALLGDGVDIVSRSPIAGRPRGVMTAGVEEPCAYVEVTSPAIDVIAPATTVELVEGLVASPRPGVGRLPRDDAPATRCDPRHAHVEVLVIGGGRSGLRAAAEAVRTGGRVMLVEERPRLGGAAPEGAEVLTRATALGLYDHGYAVIHERSRPVERLWHVRARRVILAAGAHERPIAFRDNDRPGVMLAAAVVAYLERFAVLCGERPVIFTTNDSAYVAARALQRAGADVSAIVDVRRSSPAQRDARADGVEVLSGWAVAAAEGDPRVEAVRVTNGSAERTIACDLVAVSGGWNPVVQLYRAIGGGLRYDDRRACFVPDGSGPPWLDVVGRAGGRVPPAAAYWFTPAGDTSHHYVDLQRDATVADIMEAVGTGLRSAEHVKRYTYIGTAFDQGRTSGVVGAEVVNQLLGWGPGAQGPTNARPPYAPVSYAAVARRATGALFDPARTTPMHPWHTEHGAVFEVVGQWKRPWYFPRDGESLHEAVRRESVAARTTAGVMDASTLGKIEVTGPDAPWFLDRMYTNTMSSLAVGSIRYGIMLGLDGMVMDDGVAMRLAEERYLLTTTTGGAARVLDHFEEWLQTEWPGRQVYCTSVTEQWATVAIVGPRARDVVTALDTDIDVSVEAFPWMTVRDGRVGGAAARVARVSFSGELAYEINVPGWYGLAVWEAAMAAGERFGITPYGTETMHVLRAEKGYVIVGQDTDGTVTPHDLGMSWIVSRRKGDFIGKRSLERADPMRADRKQLVGLLPHEHDALIPEGSQVTLEAPAGEPAAMAGHVTSSYHSAALGRAFSLALVARGRELHGRTVYATDGRGTIAAELTDPVFYDPEGTRRDG